MFTSLCRRRRGSLWRRRRHAVRDSFLQVSIALPALPQARDDTNLYFSVLHFSVIAFRPSPFTLHSYLSAST
jgi:hypothetical protein